MGRKLDDLNQLHVSEFGTHWWHVFLCGLHVC